MTSITSSVTKGPPRPVAGVAIPDSGLAREITGRVRDTASPPLIDQHGNAYRSSSLADVAKDKADQLIQAREQQLELPVFHVSQFVNEFGRSTPVAPEIRESLAALLINIGACRRWLAADPPNIRQARAAVERMTSNANALTKAMRCSAEGDIRSPIQTQHPAQDDEFGGDLSEC
ncbi:MAG TPA: hypothetical protein VHU42_04235 [Rhodopila sp.]|nr:hypothetical protein [Rhodopila sp.]